MSFGATAGILAGAPRLSRRGSVPSLIRPAAALLVATICAEAALVPVSAVLFWRVTLAGLLLNFAAIPLMALTQGAALATLVAGPIDDRAAAVCGLAAHVGAAGLVYSATLVDVAPWLSRDVVPPSWWLIGAYYACCVWLLRARRHVRIAAVCLGCAGLAMFIGPEAVTQSPVRPPAGRVLRVAFLDVGEGDAALVQLPGGRNLLVDAGGVAAGAFDLGERVVAPVLRVLGAPRVDTIALTHGDFDHIGGAHAILRRFGPRTVWEGVPVPPHAGLRSLQEEAAAAGVTWRTVVAGDHERAGGVDIAVLHPPPPDWERQRVRNDDSIVLELRYGEVSIVLPGDIGEEGERAVTGLLAPAAIRILKVPHHGSASSSTPAFLDAARPAAVIFSAGRGNRFGHPAPAVLERYRARRAAIFRTDQDGAIWIDTDGRRVTFKTWSGRSGEISHHFPP
jgi:competence protein ComEC